MNKKQEILDCIKTLNLTQEQANRLADVLASGGEGGSMDIQVYVYTNDENKYDIKINDINIEIIKFNSTNNNFQIKPQSAEYIKELIKKTDFLYLSFYNYDPDNNTKILFATISAKVLMSYNIADEVFNGYLMTRDLDDLHNAVQLTYYTIEQEAFLTLPI